MLLKTACIVVLGLGFAAVATVTVGGAGDELSATEILALRNGAEKYALLCSDCHASSSDARLRGVGPHILHDMNRKHGGDSASVARSIREGYPERGMPSWGTSLSEQEIDNLVLYIRETSRDLGRVVQPTPQSSWPSQPVRTEWHSFRVERVLRGGVLSQPFDIASLPDGSLLVTESKAQAGTLCVDSPIRLRLITHGQLENEAIGEMPLSKEDSHTAVAIGPDYEQTGWVYLAYTLCSGGGALIRGHIRDRQWVGSEVLFNLKSAIGRLVLDDQGYIYFSIGTGGDTYATALVSQDLASPEGKIHRLRADGAVPRDNPFTAESPKLPSVWSYGHRNPEGLAFDLSHHRLWASEMGPRGGDELNVIIGGHNYGYPIISYGTAYDGTVITPKISQAGMDQPVINWTPAIAVSAIEFYDGKAFPHWRRNLLVGSLKQRTLYRLALEADRVSVQETLLSGIERIRDIAVGREGFIFLLADRPTVTDPKADSLVRLVPRTRRVF